MLVRLNSLLVKLWHEDGGAVLSTEYMMLAPSLPVGGASGLSPPCRTPPTRRSGSLGQAVRSVRQSYHGPCRPKWPTRPAPPPSIPLRPIRCWRTRDQFSVFRFQHAPTPLVGVERGS